jgi:peptide/nickel transport system permease protein
LIDGILSRLMDVVWAFPIFLLAISLSIVLINTSITLGPIVIRSGSLWLPIFIIGIVYVPYIARPIRGQVLSLKNSEFVLAAIGLGVPSHRILWKDILPNVATTLIVFVPLMMALNMVTESALSFLSIGVQPPDASWGTIIQDGQNLLYSRPMVALAPGIAIAVTVLTLNVFGDGVRDALDPRSKLRIGGD